MNNVTSNYTATIASYLTRAAAIAQRSNLGVRVETPYLRLQRRASSASLLFHPTHIVLEMIEVEPRERHKRYGSAMLNDVIAIAEALGLRIDLIAETTTVRDQRGLVQSMLESWYRRHEFVGPNDALMRRAPTSSRVQLR
jgi:GNAT superfamily N-acetyltransferase